MTTNLSLPDPATEIGSALAVALAACDDADALAMASFGTEIHVTAKPDTTFVTAADMAVEEAVRERIRRTFPDHGLVGEEYGEQLTASGRQWIIDPIDGTHNYMRGVPIFATLLGLEIDGELALGAVSAPALRRRWFSWQGGGAWVVSTGPSGWEVASARPITVSGIDSLAAASVVYSSLSSVIRSGLAPGFVDLLGSVWRDRGLGDFYGYMLVAEGAAEAMVETDLKTWDLAGPRAILQHAGGQVTDVVGGSDLPTRGVLASNGHLHQLLLDRLAGR